MNTLHPWTPVVLLSLALLALGSSTPCQAQSADVASKRFGIGLEAGHGAGLSVKLQSSASQAWQFGLYAHDYGRYRRDHKGRYYYGYDPSYAAGSFLVHADYLMTQGEIVRSSSFRWPWYVGGGTDLGIGDGLALGIHGNLGVAWQFTRVPIDLFLEWTPRLWLVDFVQLHPAEGNGGIRIWF